jgi:hypothetical protein
MHGERGEADAAERRRERREELTGAVAEIGGQNFPVPNWSASGVCIGPATFPTQPGQRLDVRFTIPLPERTLRFQCRIGVMRRDPEKREIGGVFFGLPEDVQAAIDEHFEIAEPKASGGSLLDRLRRAVQQPTRDEAPPAVGPGAGRERAADPEPATPPEPAAPESAAPEPAAESPPPRPQSEPPVIALPAPSPDSAVAPEPAPETEAPEPEPPVDEAAERARAEALFELGYSCEAGDGRPRDEAEAARHYRAAAALGHVMAQNNLGRLYHAGLGVAQDYDEALHWYRAAAERGSADAQFNLGLLYCFGQGVPQDRVQAVVWWSVAALGGNGPAADNRDDLAAGLSASDLTHAERLAAEWLIAHRAGG